MFLTTRSKAFEFVVKVFDPGAYFHQFMVCVTLNLILLNLRTNFFQEGGYDVKSIMTTISFYMETLFKYFGLMRMTKNGPTKIIYVGII